MKWVPCLAGLKDPFEYRDFPESSESWPVGYLWVRIFCFLCAAW